MDSCGTRQTAQPFPNQAVIQRSEPNHLHLRNFPDEEVQDIFSYLPNQQIHQMFFQPSRGSLIMGHGLEGYTWPDQDAAHHHAAANIGEQLQAQTTV